MQKSSLLCALAICLIPLVPNAAMGDVGYAWGLNSNGELGDGTTINRNAPVPISFLSNSVTMLAGGFEHGIALQSGALYAWGLNSSGQLGDGTTTTHLTPIPLASPLSSSVTVISAAGNHSLAILGGGVYSWGQNSKGQIGDGTTIDRTSPLALTGTLSNGVSAIAAGGTHSLALKNGAVYAWGNNFAGQVGDGTTTTRKSPVALTGTLSTGVTAITAGEFSSFALKDGGVYAWGLNANAELGDGTHTNRPTPIALSGEMSSGVSAIAAGGQDFTLALKNGSVYAWGSNNGGVLGDGTFTEHTLPTLVAGLPQISSIAASGYTSYALTADGSLWVWGQNTFGSLGLGDNRPYNTVPINVPAPAGFRYTGIFPLDQSVLATVALIPVPEPGTACLIMCGTALLLKRRKHSPPTLRPHFVT